MQYHLRYCLACLADQQLDERGLCTKCGSDRVTGLTYSSGAVVFGDAGTYTKFGTAPPWQEQWYLTTVHFRALKAVYSQVVAEGQTRRRRPLKTSSSTVFAFASG
jgi:hypothetical protein